MADRDSSARLRSLFFASVARLVTASHLAVSALLAALHLLARCADHQRSSDLRPEASGLDTIGTLSFCPPLMTGSPWFRRAQAPAPSATSRQRAGGAPGGLHLPCFNLQSTPVLARTLHRGRQRRSRPALSTKHRYNVALRERRIDIHLLAPFVLSAPPYRDVPCPADCSRSIIVS